MSTSKSSKGEFLYRYHLNFLFMEVLNQELTQEILRLTWRNPIFMAIAIALIWLVPQLFIRKFISTKYEKRKIEIQKNKIDKLYPKNLQ